MTAWRWRVWWIPALAGLLTSCLQSAAAPTTDSTNMSGSRMAPTEDDRVPGEWLVTVGPGIRADDLTKRYRALGVLTVIPISAELYLLKFEADRSPTATQVRAAGASDVLKVQPNYRYRVSPVPDPQVR